MLASLAVTFLLQSVLQGETPPLPELAPAPGSAQAAPLACPDGQAITADTAGNCCWPGQAWNGTRCIGIPTSCPAGYAADAAGQSCALVPCAAGMTRPDGLHCCWPEQVWAGGQGRCVGVPLCPDGFAASGEVCTSGAAPPDPAPAPAAAPAEAQVGADAESAQPAEAKGDGDDGFTTVLIIVAVIAGAALVGGLLFVVLSEDDGSV